MSALKIDQVPSAFVAIGAKHNALVDVVKSMSGAGGIAVRVSDANIIIDGSGVSTTGGASGAAIEVVGSDGLLNRVPKHSTWVAPTLYPTELGTIVGNAESFLDADGFTFIDNSIGVFAALNYDGLRYVGAMGSLTANENGFIWEDALNKAYLDLDGFTINKGSATGTLGAGYLELTSGTFSVTYGATSLEFANASSEAIVSATGFEYEDASITATLGATGLRVEDTGSNRMSIDELGLQWRNGVITAYIDDDGITVRAAGSVTSNLSSTGFTYEDASITAVVGVSGIRIEDTGTNRMLIDELGLQWRDGTITAYIDYDGMTVRGPGGVTSNISQSGYTYEDASITAVLGTNGLRIEDNSTNLIRVDELGIDWTDGTNTFAVNTVGFLITTSGGSVSIPFSSVSGAIQLREIDVCVSGVAKKMTILASGYY